MKTAAFVMIALLVMVSVAFGQAPYGTEPVRNDAPIDSRFPSGVIHEYTCYRGTPVIDGDINDAVWRNVPFTEMEIWQDLALEQHDVIDVFSGETAENWLGPEDKLARFKMLWDDNGVYIVSVEDDDSYLPGPDVLTAPWTIWQGDNIQVSIDTDYATGGKVMVENEDSQITFAETGWSVVNFVDESYFSWWEPYTDPLTGDVIRGGAKGWAMELLPGTSDSPEPLANGGAIHGTYDWDSNRITFELGLELWEGIEPGGKQLLSFLSNDADPVGVSGDLEGRQGWVEWGRGIGYSKDSGLYGSLLFSDQAPTSVELSTWGKIKATY